MPQRRPGHVTSSSPVLVPRSSVHLAIGGMTCASCAGRVERRLNKLAGITATVNLVTERARVQAPATVDTAELVSAVEQAGYTARLLDDAATRPDAVGWGDPVSAHERDLRRRLAVAAILAMPLADLSLALSLFPELRFPGWEWVFLALALPMVGWCAGPFHRAAWTAARRGAASMDTLVSVGTLAATGWSLWIMTRGGPVEPGFGSGWAALVRTDDALYLDVAAIVITFLLAGRFYEARAKRSAGAALRSLLAWGAKSVEVIRDGEAQQVPIESLLVGDRFTARPGEKIASDGVVVDGRSTVDTSVVTGESVPREVTPDDEVVGGTFNVTGHLTLVATRVGADTRLQQMARLVEQAQERKAGVQRLADRISAVFVPAVLVLAAATLLGWLLLGPSPSAAVTAALAVLVVACPCALGLATPTAVLVGTGRGAQLGVFLRGPQTLESTRRIDAIVFDKTGTLTEGRMLLDDVVAADGESALTVLTLAASVERSSEHPLAAAIVAATHPVALRPSVDFRSEPGLGATATVDDTTIVVGSPLMLAERGFAMPDRLGAECRRSRDGGATVVAVGWHSRVRGLCLITDRVRPSAVDAISTLRSMGISPFMVTGDHARTAASVAGAVGLDTDREVLAEAAPEAKVDHVRRLQSRGHSVAVVGDGINDAAALSAADLGIAVGTGTDVAIEAADMVLGRDDLLAVVDAVELARRTHRTIVRNLQWAFGYNIAAIPLAVAGLLSPLVAGLAMVLSSAFVVWQSSRLRRFTPTSAPRRWQSVAL